MTKSYLLSGVLIVGVGAGSLLAQGPSDQARYDPNWQTQGEVLSTFVEDSEYDLPAFVSVVDGYAELDRDGQSSRDIENVPLEAGDRLRTTRGRVEILFDDGSVLALDEHTTVTFVSATEVELGAGRVRAQWRDRGARTGLSIHTMAGSAIMRTSGDYRVTLAESRRGDAEVEVAVARGSAELANDHGRTIVREGTRALTTSAYAPSTPYAYSAPRDAFERWTEDLEGDRYGVESARYLPDELRYYGGVFDRNGAWQHHPSYGYVWYPRVSVGWRPYNGGRWSFVVNFGYSWVGGSRWSWPTHHYGRWDRVGSRYFWIPSRPTQRRFVGYSAPRQSYTSSVSYYTRTTVRTTRPQTSRPQDTYRQGGTAVPRGTVSPRSQSQQPPRVQRSPEPQARPQSRPQSGAGTQSRQPSRTTSRPPSDTPRSSERPQRTERPERTESPQRAERPQRAEPAPQQRRSSPSATSGPPPSGSRTPSRSDDRPRASGGSDNRGQSGTAVRRRGGGS
jgi:FecR protein